MPVRLASLVACFAVVLALAAAPAIGQQSPSLGAPETQTDVAPAPETTSGTNDGGLETWQEVLIFGAGLVLLGGIAFAILGDARERASRLRGGTPETAGARVPHKHRQEAKQRARARAKAARAQRRKNR
jgi:hypothetical protein